jgi:metal-sulfur cluster biosynthetic enzyme
MTEGVESVYLELTFEPPFTPEMMSEEAQLELGFM